MSWTNQTKNSSNFSNIGKHASSFVNATKNLINQFLLKEDGGFLLLETGDKIILDQSVLSGGPWANQSKS